jgi:hypothetical protein
MFLEKRPETNIHNMTCHFINKEFVWNLFEDYMKVTDTHYEGVVALRVDLSFGSPVQFSPIIENTIYVPDGNDYYGLNDQFAYGSVDAMKKYMCMYSSSKFLLENRLSIPHPESLNLANISYHHVDIVRFPLNHDILR